MGVVGSSGYGTFLSDDDSRAISGGKVSSMSTHTYNTEIPAVTCYY